jgi:hypothetical protein
LFFGFHGNFEIGRIRHHYEKFEDTEGQTIVWPQEKEQKTNNYLQKTKIEQHEPHKIQGDLRYSRRVNNYCSTRRHMKAIVHRII